MEWSVGLVAALVLMAVGVMGTLIPVLPGLPLVWFGMLVHALLDGIEHVGVAFLAVSLAVVAAAEIAEHYVRAWGARRFGAGKAGAWGAAIGAFIGLFFLPLGLVLGPFLGAAIAELLAGRNVHEAARAGWGGVVGTLTFLPVKFLIAAGMTVAFVVRVVAS